MFECSKSPSISLASTAQPTSEHQGAALISLFGQMQTHRKHLSTDVDCSVIVSY